MEMIMIGQTKLKVMLTREDLEEFELETDALDYHKTETKRMFWDILGRAKHTIGFDTDGERVLLQLYPSRSGGCELFITKLGLLASNECAEEDCFGCDCSDRAILHCDVYSHEESRSTSLSIFCFEKTEWLLLACRRLLAAGYDRDSMAYIGDNSRLYLMLFGVESLSLPLLDEFSFLSEYGSKEDAEFLIPFIEEHGSLLCSHNAVEHLGVL